MKLNRSDKLSNRGPNTMKLDDHDDGIKAAIVSAARELATVNTSVETKLVACVKAMGVVDESEIAKLAGLPIGRVKRACAELRRLRGDGA